MKKKKISGFRDMPSSKHKVQPSEAIQSGQETTLSDDVMHDIVEALADKVEQFNEILQDFHSPPRETTSNFDPTSPDTSSSSDDSANPLLGESGERILTNTDIDDLISIQGNNSSNTLNVNSTIAHRTSYNYAPENPVSFQYGFTNSEFFAFIANLDPVEFVITVLVITILIGIQLNVFEKQVVSAALIDIGVTLGNMVQQELFQAARRNEAVTAERNQALQTDLDTLYNGIDELQTQINALKEQLGQTNR